MPALPADHDVPGDADAGGEGALVEAELAADGRDPGWQTVSVLSGPGLSRHGQFLATRYPAASASAAVAKGTRLPGDTSA
jgi:hypothetical protein